ncbi:MAG: AAA family ATPase [Candidatus Poribacteria bacterium]|nr:AAA family ATPase [Candidatus Poribacteria bacterium]
MHLRFVELINWRSYRSARFEFPRPLDSKNVILVMAPNEYGKTSFFEAVALGLFGRDGLPLVPRARAGTNNDASERIKASYSNFLEGTLHRHAIESGTPKCVVKLEWEDENGDRIEIKRTWHFRANGAHRIADDQLDIYDGQSGSLLAPPVAEPDRNLWYSNWIAQRFLHPSLAEFFLFDGEQVQRYANRNMNEQVRLGIEGLLGLPVLHSLKESLGRYAQNRRTQVASPSDDTVNAVKEAIDGLENRLDAKKLERDKAIEELQSLDGEIEDLTQQLRGREEGAVALAKSLLEDESRHRDEAQRAILNLTTLLAGDMALAIAGASLRRETISCLRSEAKREIWETGRNEGNRNLERFVSDLSEKISQLQPPISDNCHDAVIQAAKAAWHALWHPPPEDCADGYLHTALTGTTRAGTINRLTAIDQHSASEAADYVAQFESARATAEAKKREHLELERVAPIVEEQTKRLKELMEQSGRYKEQREAAQREIDSTTAELSQKQKELARYMSSRDLRAPALRHAEKADAYAALVDELLRDAVPFEVNEVADEMTRAWKEMAHMSDRVERIDISTDCEVRLLAVDGSDLHQIDKSAGASQVFTQALITAITKVSGRTFPFIVDTPLARLSREQRLGVLKTFTDRQGQVILLSTDQEVVDDKLDAIRDRIAASYQLTVTQDRGVTATMVQELDLRNV